MPISKEQALTECRDLWLWLAANPGKNKDDALELPQFDHINYYDSYCPCCEEAFYCDNCLLLDLWPRRCVYKLSTYGKWRTALRQIYNGVGPYKHPKRAAKRNALKIANAAAEKLKDLKKES